MSNKKERIVWIDQLRSVAFLFVIIGHVALPKEMKSLIYSFHMPLFFLISGLTVNRDRIINTPILDYIKKQAKSLLVPYFWMSFLCYPLWYLAFHILSSSTKLTPVDMFKGIIAGSLEYNSPSNALWFLLVLFLANILYACILKLSKGNESVLLCFVFISAIIGFLDKAFPQLWHFNVAFTAVMLLYLGNQFMIWYKNSKLYNHKLSLSYVAKLLTVVAGLVVVGLISHKMNGRISMTANKFGKSVLLFYITAIAFSFAITLVMTLIPKISFVTYIGQNTLLYLGIHIPIIRIFEKAFPDIFSQYKFSIPFAFVLYVALIPIVMFVKKCFPYVCGQFTRDCSLIQNMGKVVIVFWSTCVPFAYVMSKFGLFSFEMPYLIGNSLVLAVLSLSFVLIANKLTPFVFLEENRIRDVK